jgi:hypothetical protein
VCLTAPVVSDPVQPFAGAPQPRHLPQLRGTKVCVRRRTQPRLERHSEWEHNTAPGVVTPGASRSARSDAWPPPGPAVKVAVSATRPGDESWGPANAHRLLLTRTCGKQQQPSRARASSTGSLYTTLPGDAIREPSKDGARVARRRARVHLNLKVTPFNRLCPLAGTMLARALQPCSAVDAGASTRPRCRPCPQLLHRGCRIHAQVADTPAASTQTAEVDSVTGVRLVPRPGTNVMSVEYRIKWKDDTAPTWCVIPLRVSSTRTQCDDECTLTRCTHCDFVPLPALSCV